MAKASWCTVSPMSGKGNKTIVISATAHTGRAARSTTVTVLNQSGTKPTKDIAVSQAAKALSITKVSGPTPAIVPAIGGSVTIIGKSNAARLSPEEGSEGFANGFELKVNGVVQTNSGSTTNGTFVISGDIGATNEYDFELKMTVPALNQAFEQQLSVCITAYGKPDGSDSGVVLDVPFKVAATTSSISVSPTALNLVNAGTAQSIVLTSNDNWVTL